MRPLGVCGPSLPKPRPRILERANLKASLKDLEDEAKKHVKAREKNRCRCCGRFATDPHHLIRRSAGGIRNAARWDVRKIVLLDRECHRLIHDKVITVAWTNAEQPDGVRFSVVAHEQDAVTKLIRRRLPVERTAA